MQVKVNRKFLKKYFYSLKPIEIFKIVNDLKLSDKLSKKQKEEYNNFDADEILSDYSYDELLIIYKENNPDVECVLTEDDFYFLDIEDKKKYLNIKDDDYWWTDKQLNDIYEKRKNIIQS